MVINVNKNSITRRGVIAKSGGDFLILLITINKREDATQFKDLLHEATLFWEGQLKMKYAEKYINDGRHDIFIFIQPKTRSPYKFYGRAIPIRQHLVWESGTPSKIVFDLYEFRTLSIEKYKPELLSEKGILKTDKISNVLVRTEQNHFRQKALHLWGGSCVITGVNEPRWLIASHIKPWKESNNKERTDPYNSLLLTPNYDKLFDKGVISFSPSNGKILLPDKMDQKMLQNFEKLNIDDSKELKFVPELTQNYLNYHNKYVFNFKPYNSIIEDFD